MIADLWQQNFYEAADQYPSLRGAPLRRTADYWLTIEAHRGLLAIDGRRWSPETVNALMEARGAGERLRAAMVADARFLS